MKINVSFITAIVFLLFSLSVKAQRETLKGTIYDGVNFYPIKGANVYNFTTKEYVFSNEKGEFLLEVEEGDTLIVSQSAYRQCVEIVNKEMMVFKRYDFLLYYRAIMLDEVQIYALNPDYEKFKKEVVTLKLPDVYKKLSDIHLSEEEKMGIEYKNQGPNILRGTPAEHPITYFYNQFSKKEKLKRLALELEANQENVDIVQTKYNRDIVKKITGLSDNEVVNFMMFCRFNYYDIINWSQDEIIKRIKNNYTDYEYNKALQEKE